MPWNNILHDQSMDETRFFIWRFGYDPRIPAPWVHEIDHGGVIDPRDTIVTRQPRHPQNVRDTPRNAPLPSPRNTQSPRRNTQSPRRNTRSPRRNTRSPRRNTRSPNPINTRSPNPINTRSPSPRNTRSPNPRNARSPSPRNNGGKTRKQKSRKYKNK